MLISKRRPALSHSNPLRVPHLHVVVTRSRRRQSTVSIIRRHICSFSALCSRCCWTVANLPPPPPHRLIATADRRRSRSRHRRRRRRRGRTPVYRPPINEFFCRFLSLFPVASRLPSAATAAATGAAAAGSTSPTVSHALSSLLPLVHSVPRSHARFNVPSNDQPNQMHLFTWRHDDAFRDQTHRSQSVPVERRFFPDARSRIARW